MNRHQRRALSFKILAIATAVAGAGVTVGGQAYAAGTPGIGTPINPSTQVPLKLPAGPNSDTYQYGLGLPAQAHCAADTATHAYHIDSFIIPSSVGPGGLTYSNGVPKSANGKITYVNMETAAGSPYTLQNTAPTTGEIPTPLPAFEFFRDFRAPISLKSGNYLLGISCVTPTGTTQAFWDAAVTLKNTGTLSTDTSTFTKAG